MALFPTRLWVRPGHAFDTTSPGPVHVASLTAVISYPILDVVTSHKASADYVATSLSLFVEVSVHGICVH